MGLLVFFMWCLFIIPTALVVLWFVGSIMLANNETKATAYVAQLHDEKKNR